MPGIIVRSNTVGDDGNMMPQFGSNDVNHTRRTRIAGAAGSSLRPRGAAVRAARATGNITFSGRGNTSNQVFVDWLDSSPETRGYLSSSSDIVALLVFDHQMHAINLLTRLNWESRVASSRDRASVSGGALRGLVNELAEYLLFVGEAPPLRAADAAARLCGASRVQDAKDRQGRSSRAARPGQPPDALSVQLHGVFGRVRGLTARGEEAVLRPDARHPVGERRTGPVRAVSADDRRAVLEILRDTKPDFPGR